MQITLALVEQQLAATEQPGTVIKLRRIISDYHESSIIEAKLSVTCFDDDTFTGLKEKPVFRTQIGVYDRQHVSVGPPNLFFNEEIPIISDWIFKQKEAEELIEKTASYLQEAIDAHVSMINLVRSHWRGTS